MHYLRPPACPTLARRVGASSSIGEDLRRANPAKATWSNYDEWLAGKTSNERHSN